MVVVSVGGDNVEGDKVEVRSSGSSTDGLINSIDDLIGDSRVSIGDSRVSTSDSTCSTKG